MDALSTDLTPADAPELSTQLDAGRAPNEATPHKEDAPEQKQPESRLDAIKRAAEDVEKTTPKAEEPKEEPAKEAPKTEEKPAPEGKVEAKEEAPKTEERPKQGRQVIEPPEKFLPRAKELWVNVPHEVRSEVARSISEAQAEAQQARESVKEYESLRPYVDMAKQSGTTIDQAFGRYVQMEETLRSNPTEGFRALAHNMGISPVQMIGHIMAAHNVRPEQLAQHMMQSPNDYTALARQQPQAQQQPQTAQEIQALKQELANMQMQQQNDAIMRDVIKPFADEHPRYHELEGAIAQFLNSDIIPRSLSHYDRLAAAYDAAVRVSPSVRQAPASDPVEQPESRAGDDFGGTKSVRGAPATGVDTSSRRRSKMSRGDALNAAMADLGLAH